MTARIINADVFDALPTLAPGSVDCVITSPPYYQLRDYGTGTWEGGNDPECEHKVRGPAGMASCGLRHPGVGTGAVNHAQEGYRDLCGKCGARRVDKQLGMEATVEEYIARLVEVFRLVRAVMAPWGVAFVNIGDTYSNGNSGEMVRNSSGGVGKGEFPDDYQQGYTTANPGRSRGHAARMRASGIPPGNLCLVPQRLAIALQGDGWLVRSVIVWQKSSPMPQSLAGWAWRRCRQKICKAEQSFSYGLGQACGHGGMRIPLASGGVQQADKAQWADCPGCPKCKDHGGYVLRRGSWRPTSSWEPILMLAKQSGYYADGESVKTPSQGYTPREFGRKDPSAYGLSELTGNMAPGVLWQDDGGANARDVLRIAAEPLSERHYAAFPTALVEWCLRAGTSAKGHCPACGAPWARVIEATRYEPPVVAVGVRNVDASRGDKTRKLCGSDYNESVRSETLGWRPTCSHDDLPPRAPLVLDPFAGSGRVGVACARLGCDFVGVELSESYCRLAERLCRGEAPLFADLEGS